MLMGVQTILAVSFKVFYYNIFQFDTEDNYKYSSSYKA